MTVTLPPPAPTPGRLARTRHVLAGEWTKLAGLRSTALLLTLGALGTVVVSALTCWFTARGWAALDPASKARFDPVVTSLEGIPFGQLAFGVLGALAVTREYASGTIRTTMAAVPRRLPVLAAKVAVVALGTLVVALAATAVSFAVGQALLGSAGGHGVDIGAGAVAGHEPVLRAVVGGALYLVGVAVTGVAAGALLRSTAGAVTAVIGLYFVLPPVVGIFPQDVADAVRPWLPSWAGAGLWAPAPQGLPTWPGFLLYCGYVLLLAAAAGRRLARTDV